MLVLPVPYSTVAEECQTRHEGHTNPLATLGVWNSGCYSYSSWMVSLVCNLEWAGSSTRIDFIPNLESGCVRLLR